MQYRFRFVSVIVLIAATVHAQESRIVRIFPSARREQQAKLEGHELTEADWKSLGAWDMGDESQNISSFETARSRPLLMVTWAHWYPPSLDALTSMQELFKKYEKYAFVVGVHHKIGSEDSVKIARARNVTFPIVSDVAGRLRDELEVPADPCFYVFDKAGNIRYADINARSASDALLLTINEKSSVAKGRSLGPIIHNGHRPEPVRGNESGESSSERWIGIAENVNNSEDRLLLQYSLEKPSDELAIPVENFEAATFAGWKSEGDAFSGGPFSGRLIDTFTGKLVNSWRDDGGDALTGTLTSELFEIKLPWIFLRVGGGKNIDELSVSLVIDSNTKIQSSGRNDNSLRTVRWDVRDYIGQLAKIEIRDSSTGDWGHILVDEILEATSDQMTNLVSVGKTPKELEAVEASIMYDIRAKGNTLAFASGLGECRFSFNSQRTYGWGEFQNSDGPTYRVLVQQIPPESDLTKWNLQWWPFVNRDEASQSMQKVRTDFLSVSAEIPLLLAKRKLVGASESKNLPAAEYEKVTWPKSDLSENIFLAWDGCDWLTPKADEKRKVLLLVVGMDCDGSLGMMQTLDELQRFFLEDLCVVGVFKNTMPNDKAARGPRIDETFSGVRASYVFDRKGTLTEALDAQHVAKMYIRSTDGTWRFKDNLDLSKVQFPLVNILELDPQIARSR
jgi:hypothetical protein